MPTLPLLETMKSVAVDEAISKKPDGVSVPIPNDPPLEPVPKVIVPAKLAFLHLRLGDIWPISKVLSDAGIKLLENVAEETLLIAD